MKFLGIRMITPNYVKQDVLEKKIQIFTIINLYVTLNEKGIRKECVKYFECLD